MSETLSPPLRRTSDVASPLIEVDGLDVAYRTLGGQSILALKGVDLAVRPREFCVIVGPSGCGKSTLLKVLAGLVRTTAGTARLAGDPVGQPRDDIGYVFQSPVLLPWFTILQNVMLPLRVQRRPDRAAGRRRALDLLELVGLKDFADRYPRELSGGMQQRVGMARALVNEPSLLLMDEPFGALDALTRETMNQELQRIWLADPKTVLFVTHGISEAVFLADRVVVMSQRPGSIVADIAIDLPRPRHFEMVDSAVFGQFAREIRAALSLRGEP